MSVTARLVSVLTTALLWAPVASAHAPHDPPLVNEHAITLSAPDAQPGASFGTAIATTDDYIVVTAPLHNTSAGTNAGQAYLFDAEGKHEQTFTAPDGQAHAFFGFAAAVAGDVIVIGAGLHDTADGNESGQVYLFAPDGSHLETLAAPDGHALAQFGFAVAAVDDRILVSANRQHVDGHAFAGQAYLFGADGTHLQTFAAPEPQSGAAFGYSVAGVGEHVLIGAWAHDTDAGPSTGQAYLFAQDGTHLQTFAAPDAEPQAQFGVSVAGVGEHVLVGAWGHDNGAGRAYLFAQDGTHLQTFSAPDAQAGAHFGFSVAGVGDNVIVGARGHDTDGGAEAGKAYLFDQDGQLLDSFEAPEPEPFTNFGQAVAGWGPDVVVGSPRADEAAGHVYIFRQPVGTDPAADENGLALEAPYPNPATRATSVAFTLPTATEVRIDVVDVLGRRVAVLTDRELPAGDHSREFDVEGLASGIYVVRLVGGGRAVARRLTVVR